MRKEMKRELSFSIQYFVIVLAAFVIAFFKIISDSYSEDGEIADAINFSVAWGNVDPYVKSVLLIFCALSIIRFCIVFLMHAFRKS